MTAKGTTDQRIRFALGATVAAWVLLWAPSMTMAQESKQALFERVFGDAVKLDPATVAKVKALPPGERFHVDRDGDGKNDEVWFIDTAYRHTDDARPLLVRVIDEDGDLDAHMGPDLDSDLYIADWNADGQVDVVLDYQDNDGDNDLDEMAFYFYMKRHISFGKDVLRVWWGSDDGDDNLLWYDVNYNYYQGLCQYRCHLSGEESLVAFGLKADSDRWISAFENPFLFYDPDGDLCSEVVMRIQGLDDEVRTVRYSFDVDDDAWGRRTHDYDFSITVITEKGRPVRLPDRVVKGMNLRGIPTQRWLQRQYAQELVAHARWYRACLTWDEMNANTAGKIQADPNERWEGVIVHKSENFPGVGGPSCGPINKRNEVSLKPQSPLRLYYDPTDHRLHLKGANEGWIHVDYDFDGKVDAEYVYVDENQDGILDRRQLDVDADGQVDFDWRMNGEGAKELALDWQSLTAFYKPMLKQVLADSQAFIDAAKAALGGKLSRPDPVEVFFLTKLENWLPEAHVGEQIRKTPAGARFYVDLLRDRLLGSLKKNFGQHAQWDRIERHYAEGNYRAAAGMVARELSTTPARSDKVFRSFTRRIEIRVDNSGRKKRMDWPITLAIRDIQKTAADFNPANCAIVAPERWIDWRQIPHQIDEIDRTVGREISFLIDVAANAAVTYSLYYSPTGTKAQTFKPKTCTAEDWVPPNIGWESNRVGYRAYWGQFDFFGKKTERLIYENMPAKSYHTEADWGIDALHVNKTSGLGGITLYVDGKAYPAQDPGGKGDVKFTKRQVAKGPVRAVIEWTAGNVVPSEPDLTVCAQCIVYAERQESEIRVSVENRNEQAVLVAPGVTKLPREKVFTDPASGCLGSWGYQEEIIDEVGLGLIVPPDQLVDAVDIQGKPGERRLRCRVGEDGQLRYWIIGDWRRGRQHPVAPNLDNWKRELQALADLVHHDVSITLSAPAQVP